MTESVLQEAERIINGDRALEYGDVSVNFTRIGNLWAIYKGGSFSPHDVAQMMILVKVARQANGYHRDSNVDIAGYAGLDEQVYDKIQESFNHIPTIIFRQQDKPRQWEFVNRMIPDDVKTVVDAKGKTWRTDAEGIWRRDVPYTHGQYHGPFTELLEDK